MTLAEILEEYRGGFVRGLQNTQQERATKLSQLQQEILELEAAQGAAEDALRRSQFPFPSPDICPHCWLSDGRSSSLFPKPHGAESDATPDQDIMWCRICFWEAAADY